MDEQQNPEKRKDGEGLEIFVISNPPPWLIPDGEDPPQVPPPVPPEVVDDPEVENENGGDRRGI
ncbi:hypothetical protein Mapa_001029 [Marchantia paleacea]|nr:hypothetical protein Mapa_001029 [Marchantia paleacea]